MKFDPHKINSHTVQYKLSQHNETQTYLIDWPSFIAVNNEYTSSYALIRIVIKGHIAMHTILF